MARTLQFGTPFQPQKDFRREIDELFSRFTSSKQTDRVVAALPVIELFRDGDEYVIKLDVAGIDPKDIEVTILDRVVIIRASREHHDKQQHLVFLHCELAHGDFERSVTLPHGVKSEDVKAVYDRGVLKLRMPASMEPVGRKIQIQNETTTKVAYSQPNTSVG